MTYHEYFGNIHMHTVQSDGEGTFEELLAAAHQAGLDFVYVTDHNVLVRDEEEGYRNGILTMVGQEVHNQALKPSRNHLLCLGVDQDVTAHAADPQKLIDAVNEQGALTFLAHPVEVWTDLAPDHYEWEPWEVTGYTGVEIWNYMSVFRQFVTSKPRALWMSYVPHRFTTGPLPEMLQKWDELTQERPVVALGGTDVHASIYTIGPLKRCFLPYSHCTQALNTHILTATPMLGPDPSMPTTDRQHERSEHDHQLVLAALRAGHCWIGYDLAGSTKGFRFSAWQAEANAKPDPTSQPDAIMGDTLAGPVPGQTIQFTVDSPEEAEIRLLRNGKTVVSVVGYSLSYASSDIGVYRVEVWRKRWGQQRGWIFSNPIYIR